MRAAPRRRDACACGLRSRAVLGSTWRERRITGPVFNPGATAARRASTRTLDSAPERTRCGLRA
jgi:hypothetical protein